jgi:hypothetical protein
MLSAMRTSSWNKQAFIDITRKPNQQVPLHNTSPTGIAG